MAGQLSQECEPYILPLFQDHSEALMGKDVSWLCKALGIYNLFTTLIYNIEKFLNELFSNKLFLKYYYENLFSKIVLKNCFEKLFC